MINHLSTYTFTTLNEAFSKKIFGVYSINWTMYSRSAFASSFLMSLEVRIKSMSLDFVSPSNDDSLNVWA